MIKIIVTGVTYFFFHRITYNYKCCSGLVIKKYVQKNELKTKVGYVAGPPRRLCFLNFQMGLIDGALQRYLEHYGL